MCILSVYALLKAVGYDDLSVLSMSVMGFQKKKLGGWVGVVSSIQFLLDFLNFAKPLKLHRAYDAHNLIISTFYITEYLLECCLV